ncbi:MAG: hypothetical protein U0525_03880 [Patescibacteria group bacterium]
MSTISIKIDPSWKLLVGVGDEVTMDTAIATTGEEEKPTSHVIPLAKTLNFSPDKIFKFLKKNIGQQIHRGEVVAEKDGMFSSKKFVSEFSGSIVSVNHHNGEITIEEKSSKNGLVTIKSMVVGKVSKTDDNELIIKTGNSMKIKVSGSFQKRIGGNVIVSDNTKAILLTLPEVKGAVIFVPNASDYVVSKLNALGAAYIITTSDVTIVSNDLILEDASVDNLNKIIDFDPKYIYGEPGETEITLYK